MGWTVSIKILSSDQSVVSRQHSLKRTAMRLESSWSSMLGKGDPSELRMGPGNSPSYTDGVRGRRHR